MLVTLDHEQLVAAEILVGDVPRFPVAAFRSADAEPRALTDRVEGESDVAADDAPFERADSAGRAREVAVQELAERPLADEADPGRVLLRVRRQPRLARDGQHVGLLHGSGWGEEGAEVVMWPRVADVGCMYARVLGVVER